MNTTEMPTESLSFDFKLNPEDDDNSIITLNIGTDTYACELYYFALYAEQKYKRIDKNSFLISIADALKGWHRLLQDNNSNETLYFPFELSDQYSRWIACSIEDQHATLAAGYCSLEGWAVSLSEPELHQEEIIDFVQTGNVTIRTTKMELDSWLTQTIKLFEEYDS